MGNFILMPKLGMTMTEGQITKWLVQEGQQIEKGDFLFEVETDKTTLDVDSLYKGVMRKLYYEELTVVPVNTPVAFIGEENEEIPELAAMKLGETTETAVSTTNTSSNIERSKPETTTQFEIDKTASYEYDLVVIGAGPGGYVAAIRAAQLGAKVAVIEKDFCGGTCLNRGCIPTKALYYKAKEWTLIKNAAAHGFTTGETAFDWEKILAGKDGTVKQLVKGVGQLLSKNGIRLIKGSAVVKHPHVVSIGDTTVTAQHIALATGSRPLKKISAETALFDTDQILDLRLLPQKLVIIGGGVIGCEMAHIFSTFGVGVTIIEVMPRILPMTDAELAASLAKSLKANGVMIVTDTIVESVTGGAQGYCVHTTTGGAIDCDLVLEAIGRQPDHFAIKDLGIRLTSRGYIDVDADFVTSIECVYAIGDSNGKSQLAHSASHQGIQLAEHLFGGAKKCEEQPVPSCIFSALEIATVGKTLEEAKKAGLDAREFKIPYMSNGKALAMNAKEGFVKVVADSKYGEIIGVHIIGEQASALLHEAVMVMRGELTASEAGHTIHVHPTLNEMMMEAFLGVSSGAINL